MEKNREKLDERKTKATTEGKTSQKRQTLEVSEWFV